jgi:hypothetical protein
VIRRINSCLSGELWANSAKSSSSTLVRMSWASWDVVRVWSFSSRHCNLDWSWTLSLASYPLWV